MRKENGCMQTVRNFLLIISTLLSWALLTQCTPSIRADRDIEQRSVYLANHIDSHSLNLLRDFSYGAKNDDHFWLRVSGDTNLYVCNFRLRDDTAKLSIWRPDKFIRDFSTSFRFDTSIYARFTFSKVQDQIVSIELDSSRAGTLVEDLLVKTGQLFPDKNPFITFSELAAITNKYHFTGSSYSSGMGDFFVFWISPRFKLLYIPDTLQINPKFKKYWLDEFKKGKKIKQGWSLIDVYDNTR
ncbi:MAG TPA: hypothetical protein PLL71_06070 [Agriterribacter sp.]|nr:hypothetical protein [Agriterribacter sp.]HRQ49345.1 hypothetical protein [Agriterribacter sp.]